jgi:hypothetical protein
MNKYYLLFDKDNYQIHNPKAHDILFKYLINISQKIYVNLIELKKFIKENNQDNIFLFYYLRFKRNRFTIDFIKFINNFENLKIQIKIFTFDFWKYKNGYSENDIFVDNVFKTNNYKVITFSKNLEQLNFFHNYDYTEFKENIIFYNIWCCYDKSFCNFNNNPYKKLLMTGAINRKHYPERFILNNLVKKINFIYRHNYNQNDVKNNTNNYNLTLNKYFACFSSSVYVQRSNNNKNYFNTHILLLKTFEILASGSLLVMPKKEEEYLKKYDLIHNENCYLINFNNNIIEQINFIFDNIDKYDIVRKKGQELAKEKFNSDIKINEIKKLLDIK